MGRWTRFFSRCRRMMEGLCRDVHDFLECRTHDDKPGMGSKPSEGVERVEEFEAGKAGEVAVGGGEGGAVLEGQGG